MSIDSTLPLPSLSAGISEPDVHLNSLRRFTVEEYHALIDSGFFSEDENYELLEGLLVHKMGKNRPHSLATRWLRQLLEPMLHGYYVDAQEPVSTNDSEPEPDVSVVRGQPEDYKVKQPPADATVLVVEVSESTLRQDRRLKKRIYARAGIPVYWIVNLIDRQIEIYTQPSGPAEQPDYANCEIIAADGEVPVMIDGREVGRLAVKDVLP